MDILRLYLKENVMWNQSASLDKKFFQHGFQEREKVSVRNYSGPEKF